MVTAISSIRDPAAYTAFQSLGNNFCAKIIELLVRVLNVVRSCFHSIFLWCFKNQESPPSIIEKANAIPLQIDEYILSELEPSLPYVAVSMNAALEVEDSAPCVEVSKHAELEVEDSPPCVEVSKHAELEVEEEIPAEFERALDDDLEVEEDSPMIEEEMQEDDFDVKDPPLDAASGPKKKPSSFSKFGHQILSKITGVKTEYATTALKYLAGSAHAIRQGKYKVAAAAGLSSLSAMIIAGTNLVIPNEVRELNRLTTYVHPNIGQQIVNF